LNLLNIVH